jgi:hypothetical protein
MGMIIVTNPQWELSWKVCDHECDYCEEFALEVWERQTQGGVINEDGPGIYSIEDCDHTVTKERI